MTKQRTCQCIVDENEEEDLGLIGLMDRHWTIRQTLR